MVAKSMYYKGIGFDNAVVLLNQCREKSDDLDLVILDFAHSAKVYPSESH